MMRVFSLSILALTLASLPAHAGFQLQGFQLQGYGLQGFSSDGKKEVVVSFPYSGMKWRGKALGNVRVERGGLVGEIRHRLSGRAGLEACRTPQKGIARNCGWTLAAVGSCRPGAAVAVGAARRCELGASSGNQMLRVCAGTSRTCEHNAEPVGPRARSGMIAENDDSSCGGKGPQASFRCPAAGGFLVMAAEHDSAQPVQVNLAARGATLRKTHFSGTDFQGVTLRGLLDTGAGTERAMDFRIAEVKPEDPAQEPKTLPPGARGWTWLYRLEVRVPRKGWQTACAPDPKGATVALPVGAVWPRNGKRQASTTRFTFSCTAGAVAKCYRWGYRPWYLDPADPKLFERVHVGCTRMARADYCGDGMPHTKAGTTIFEWDNLQPPIATPLGQVPTTMMFESGWAACGAICLSKFRWQQLRAICFGIPSCLYRPPVAGAARGQLVANVCDTQAEAEQLGKQLGRDVRLFNLSNVNP
jgi:hypothetical protein